MLPWPTDSLPWILFVTGLAGGAGHCVGMCGPFVAGYAITLRNPRNHPSPSPFPPGPGDHVRHRGRHRRASGSFVRVAAWVAPLQSLLLAATGVLIALMGFRSAAGCRGRGGSRGAALSRAPWPGSRDARPKRAARARLPPRDGDGAAPVRAGVHRSPLGPRSGMEGGSPADGFVRGSLAMAAFGAGTFPALFLFGKVVAAAGPRLRGTLTKVAAALLVAPA